MWQALLPLAMAGANMIVSAATKSSRDKKQKQEDITNLKLEHAADTGGMSGMNRGNKYLLDAENMNFNQRQSDANPPINPIGLALQAAGAAAGGGFGGGSSATNDAHAGGMVGTPKSLGGYDDFMGDGAAGSGGGLAKGFTSIDGMDADDDYWKRRG